MKLLFIAVVGISSLFLLFNCNTPEQQIENECFIHQQDSLQLKDLVKQYLKWADSNARNYHTLYIAAKKTNPTDTNYKSVDWDVMNKNVTDIQSTKLFTKNFISNFKSLSHHLDSALKEGKIIWNDGEVPNFAAADIDSWCNCQDKPDSFLEKITLSPIIYDKENAQFSWTWGGTFNYQIKAKKTNGKWYIDYLEGFDIKNFTGN